MSRAIWRAALLWRRDRGMRCACAAMRLFCSLHRYPAYGVSVFGRWFISALLRLAALAASWNIQINR